MELSQKDSKKNKKRKTLQAGKMLHNSVMFCAERGKITQKQSEESLKEIDALQITLLYLQGCY